MNRKAKGTVAERELVHRFWKAGWGTIRVAGSGSTKYPAPDLVTGNGIRRLVIECKSVADRAVYLSKKEIDDLRVFGNKLAAEPWVGVRFSGGVWLFVGLEELEETGSGFVVHLKTATLRGLSFDEIIGE